jgi:asparagine synthase (glutamine-hydrolysing)
MCGICGYAGMERDERLLRAMTSRLVHRGPDDDGVFVHQRVGLGIRRLSIIDVSGGMQPLFNERRSVAVVANGEIYNFRELMANLEGRGHRFTTRSDTETIVHLYEEYGIGCLQYLRGMFAFALYDADADSLFLARDRLGIKPLYYWQGDGKLLFASEIKALLASDDVSCQPNPAAITAFLTLRYVPGPQTMFHRIYKLPAGHWLRYRDNDCRVEPYWAPAITPGPYRDDREYHERFAELWRETLRLHLASDVPVGAYLSGGLDSSLVTAEMAQAIGHPIHTFSVGSGWEGDETAGARAVAEQLGCIHHELLCKPEDLRWLPRIIWHSDEPLGDPITLPTFLLSSLAGQHVKVVLTGEGADEVLAGYLFHRVLDLTHRLRAVLPAWVFSRIAGPLLHHVPVRFLDRFFDYPSYLGEQGRRRVVRFLQVAATDSPAPMYETLIGLFDGPEQPGLYAPHSALLHTRHTPIASSPPPPSSAFLDQALLLQYRSWLPDNILARQDKMSMAHSVEARVPFLDHVLVEFLLTVPPHLKLRSPLGQNKILARTYARRLLPPSVAGRRKTAFHVPPESYLDAPIFRELVARTLQREHIQRRGYFDPDAVRTLIHAAQTTREFIRVKQVLALVMLELWHQIFVDRVAWNVEEIPR